MLGSKIALEVEKFEKKVLREVPRGPPHDFGTRKQGVKRVAKNNVMLKTGRTSILGRFWADLGSIWGRFWT